MYAQSCGGHGVFLLVTGGFLAMLFPLHLVIYSRGKIMVVSPGKGVSEPSAVKAA